MPAVLKKTFLSILLIAFASLSAAGMLDPGLERAGMQRLHRFNERYLDDAFEKALAGFVILSGIKSGLAVIEGSEVGVGFNLQVGDMVQPLYDYVDIAWRAAMAGGGVIALMQMALKGLRLIDHWLLAGWLIVLLGCCASVWLFSEQNRWWQMRLRELARLGANLTIACYVLLPLTVMAAAALSERITAPVVAATHEELRQFKDTLAPEKLAARFFGAEPGGDLGLLDVKTRLSQMGDGLKAVATYLTHQTERIAGLILKLLAAYLFDCILFPLFFGLILMTLLRSGVSYLFDLHGHVERGRP